MSSRKFKDSMPLAPLKIVALGNQTELGEKINKEIIARRHKALSEMQKPDFKMTGYDTENYLVSYDCPRFGTGEAKCVINESMRGVDLFIIVDTVNYGQQYTMRNETTNMSPDDFFMDLKRVIMACSGHPRRITVIMPYLYEGRQHIRYINESLDCAQALQELVSMGVETIITFDAHDNRVQNAIPNHGFDNFFTSFQFIDTVVKTNPDIKIDPEHMMVISPDLGGMKRAVYYAGALGIEMGLFYKRMDYSKLIDGEHPVVSTQFLGNDVSGKDIIIIDDMISSGESMIDVASELKKRGASRVFCATTFGLFTNGFDKFDEAYEKGIIDKILTTNLVYQPDELLSKPWYINVDMSKYMALLIDTLNHDSSISDLLNPVDRIQKRVKEYNERYAK